MVNVKGAYSNWTADIGWTAWARRRVSSEHSEIPMYFTLPALKVSGECKVS